MSSWRQYVEIAGVFEPRLYEKDIEIDDVPLEEIFDVMRAAGVKPEKAPEDVREQYAEWLKEWDPDK